MNNEKLAFLFFLDLFLLWRWRQVFVGIPLAGPFQVIHEFGAINRMSEAVSLSLNPSIALFARGKQTLVKFIYFSKLT